MLIGDVELKRYVKSHDPMCLHTVVQFLEIAGWSPEVETWLRDYLREVAKEGGLVRKWDERIRADEHRELVPTKRHCPKCGALIGEMRMPTCETNNTGRVLYEECPKCSYYSETFIKDGEELEVEGGQDATNPQ